MQGVTSKIVLNKKYSTSFGFILNQLLLLALCSFLFQSFYPVSGHQVDAGLASVHNATKIEQHNSYSSALIQSPIPPKAANLLLEADLTTEDEDDRRFTVSDFCRPFSNNLFNNEGGYNSYLKNRFLHLNSQVNSRPSIAFFILYHSWKSDLS
jgi:hypothetical protein